MTPETSTEIVLRNDFPAPRPTETDLLEDWIDGYFQWEVTTAPSSQAVQRRDLRLFLAFLRGEESSTARLRWTPRLSHAFRTHLRSTLAPDGRRRWSDKTVNRITAHLKTFARWLQKRQPFPLGNPMAKLTPLKLPSVLEIERALTESEQRRLLDAADRLLETGGRSRDRKAHGAAERPRRKGYRPYRNRAVVYALIGTGMRRAAVRNLNLQEVNFDQRLVSVEDKGGVTYRYHISREALAAIRDYLTQERPGDDDKWRSPALFLSSATNAKGDGRLSVVSINNIWNEVCRAAGITGKTPHSARHAMGKRVLKNTGNVAAVQRQLGHKNAAYSLAYARPSHEELDVAING